MLHPKLDGLDEVGRAEVMVFLLIGIDQRRHHFTLIRLRGLLLGLEACVLAQLRVEASIPLLAAFATFRATD